MYELDDSKDQLMTVLKLALCNLAMWVRDKYFAPEYSRGTWPRLAPFFRLPGQVAWGTDTSSVELRAYNDRQLNRDLAALCARVTATEPKLADGRRLVLSVEGGTLLVAAGLLGLRLLGSDVAGPRSATYHPKTGVS